VNKANRLRRLCELRQLEEQNRAALLEEAKKNLQQLDDALVESGERQKSGRALMKESLGTGDLESRVAAIEEIAFAKRKTNVLISRRHSLEEQVRQTREQFFSKRKERQQTEALLRDALDEEATIAERGSQSALDEWHRTTHRRPTWLTAPDDHSTGSPNT
jgi:hypothetical protein